MAREKNVRGKMRVRPDPIAIQTKGIKTTYEPRTIRGVLKAKSRPRIVKARTRTR